MCTPRPATSLWWPAPTWAGGRWPEKIASDVKQYTIQLLDSGGVLYWEDRDYALKSFSLAGGVLTYADTVADDGFTEPQPGLDAAGNAALYFYADLDHEAGTGDLVCYADGACVTVAREISGCFVMEESGAIYTVGETEYDDRQEVSLAQLSLLRDEETVEIEDEAAYVYTVLLDDTRLPYISDGDLYLWDGEESRRLARAVEKVLSTAQEDYSRYSAWRSWYEALPEEAVDGSAGGEAG